MIFSVNIEITFVVENLTFVSSKFSSNTIYDKMGFFNVFLKLFKNLNI